MSKFINFVRQPSPSDKIYKDDCMLCYEEADTSEDGGLYICMLKYLAFCKQHVSLYHAKDPERRKVFLRHQRTKKLKQKETGEDGNDEIPPQKVTKLALGVPGGFKNPDDKYTFEDKYNIVLLPTFESFDTDDVELPMIVSLTVDSIVKGKSALKQETLSAASGTWEGEVLSDSVDAETLVQVDNGKMLPPDSAHWTCERCSLTSNLWLNLSDGAVLCGRKFFDGTGGNNHALHHYQESKYPLSVKLGTISADESTVDVFSYSEDKMVRDPHLQRHLAHFGIKMSNLKKTEQTLTEIEIDMNQRIGEWSTLTESGGGPLKVMSGVGGFTGMVNLGNSCYLNSVVQVLFSIPCFISEYVEKADDTFSSILSVQSLPKDPLHNFHLQMTKLGFSLHSDKFPPPPSTSDVDCRLGGIRPFSFRHVVCKNHSEFSSKAQQDAQEFYLHMFSVLEEDAKRRNVSRNAGQCLQFKVEDRIECGESGAVKYMTRIEDYLPLPIPVEQGDPKLEGQPCTKVTFEDCLTAFSREEVVANFHSPVTKNRTFARKRMSLRTFPNFLCIQLKKFGVGKDWVPYKINVEVEMPDVIDLSKIASVGTGLQPDETEMPNNVDDAESTTGEDSIDAYDECIVVQLISMGFGEAESKKAAVAVKNASFESALEWILQPAPPVCEPTPTPNESTINDDSFLTDGSPSKYQLHAFISHMGSNIHCGHYVAHIRKGEGGQQQWVIYNDEKVALSENPPKHLGYLYFYRRV